MDSNNATEWPTNKTLSASLLSHGKFSNVFLHFSKVFNETGALLFPRCKSMSLPLKQIQSAALNRQEIRGEDGGTAR